MRLTSIFAQNFLGYESVEVDLSDVTDLVIVGPNGAGKSSLLDAITWALFDTIHRPGIRASGDRVIRDGADLASVVVGFEAGGHRIGVTRQKPRGKTGTLGLVVDGEQQTKHTTAETFAAIEKYVGLSLPGLLAGPFMVQKESDSFMAMQPRDRKDLLIRLLELDVYERLHEAAKKEMREWEAARAAAEQRIGPLRQEVASYEHLPVRLAAARDAVEAARHEVFDAEEALASAREALAAASAADTAYESVIARIARLFEERRDVDQQLAAARQKVSAHEQPAPEPSDDVPAAPSDEYIARARDGLQAAREARERYMAAETEHRAAEAAVARATRDAATIESVPCQHLAGQGFEEGAAIADACRSCRFLTDAVVQQEAIPTLTAKADALRRAADENATLAGLVVERAAQVDRALEAQRAALKVESARAAWAERERSRVELLATHQERVADLEGRHASIEAEWNAAHAEALPLRESHDRAEDLRGDVARAEDRRRLARAALLDAEGPWRDLVAADARREAAVDDLKRQEQTREHATEQANTYRILSLAFGRDGIPTSIIEGTIPVIEAAANEVLARLPGDMSLSLRTQRESKAGGMIDRLEVVVITDGWEREYGLLSVGQRFRVDLALRIGLSRVLSHRSDARIETLWLDEPLADLDAEAREAVIETLGAVRDDFALTVVVSHHPEFNDHFTNVLHVSMDGGVSAAVLV